MADDIEERIGRIIERIGERIDLDSEWMIDAIDRSCASPIEKALAAEMLDLFCPSNQIDTLFMPQTNLDLDLAIARANNWFKESSCGYIYGPRPRVVIFPQVTIGRLRVDFIVIGQDDDFITVEAKTEFVVVECDGHDFHERTKDQAARDRQRDRILTAANIDFLRFTGSEIYRDAAACMVEVETLLWRKLIGKDNPFKNDHQDQSDG